MSSWAEIFLGVIALATLTTAILQVGVLIAGFAAVKRVNALVDRVEQRLDPTFVRVDAIGERVSQVAALAVRQAERVEVALEDGLVQTQRVLARVRDAVETPAREKAAWTAGARALVGRLRKGRAGLRSRGDGGAPWPAG